KQVEKLLKDRQEMFFETKVLNWASAELLAYGSMLSDGNIVRVSGQDVERGTFSHRHAVIHDSVTSEPYNSLNHIGEGQEKLRIYNSLLSEYGVLGFEFGYAMANPNALTIWEAQFGDFSNGAQTMIDQFITAGESKWQRMNGIVMLLPHGYEGQGPEHSNARPERFLQLAAENNFVVANITLPANFFHLLRRQLAWKFRKPCIVMSPKSMLRSPMAVSPISDFTQGGFREVIGETNVAPKGVKRVLMVSGKLFWELLEKQQAEKRKDIAIVRLEQLHPFPQKQVEAELAKYGKAEIVWVQEEPENMGYWSFILQMMRNLNPQVIARKPSASPATGYGKVHAKEQAELINKAFTLA
ncbi:MAG: 2-oxoglutarate dehydrogenase E1 component, partial [Flexibacteraceae bacterium]